MDAKSGSESTGPVTWGVIIGILVLVGATGAYMSGVFDQEPEGSGAQTDVVDQPVQDTATDQNAAAPEGEGSKPSPSENTETAQTETPAEPKVETAQAETEAAPELSPPTLDQIFVEPDGNAVLSGSAEPGALVRVLLDGETLHSFTVDGSGQFAVFVTIPFANTARGLVLETDRGDQPVRSDDYLIAALPEPKVEIAAAEPAEDASATPEGQETSSAGAETAQTGTSTPEDDQVASAGQQSDDEQNETSAPTQGGEQLDTAQAEAAPTADAVPDTLEEPVQEETQNQQVAILRSGEDGVELVQPASPQDSVSDQVALDTIGYSDTGDVELTGRVPDGSVVRLYLNNRLVADLPPTDDGKWRSELEGVDPGVYTLRVDEVGTDGTVVSRLETPFKREPLEVLRAADTANGSAAPDAPVIRSVTVQEGDTLWAISRDRYGDGLLFVRVFEANRNAIRDPDLIYPGQVFTIPE